MGYFVNKNMLDLTPPISRLLIYGYTPLQSTISLNRALAEEILSIQENQRSLQLEKCFSKVISRYPDHSVFTNFDVLFNPNYQVDVLTMLTAAYKRRPFSLVWPGHIDGSKLIYSEIDYLDYRTYDISGYDIVCII